MAGEFLSTLTDGVVYFADKLGKSLAMPLVNNPSIIIAIRNEPYTDKNKIDRSSWNLAIYMNATVSPDKGISFANSGDAQKSATFNKSIKHCKAIVNAFKRHKLGGTEATTIYDNESDKKDGGSIKIHFNQGLPAGQHGPMQKANIDYVKITGTKKAFSTKNGRQQPHLDIIIGDDDIERFVHLCNDARLFHKANEPSLTAEHQNSTTVSNILNNAKKRKASASAGASTPSKKKVAKKQFIPPPAAAAAEEEEEEIIYKEEEVISEKEEFIYEEEIESSGSEYQ